MNIIFAEALNDHHIQNYIHRINSFLSLCSAQSHISAVGTSCNEFWYAIYI